MARKVILSFLIALSFIGCGKYKLRPDPSVAATEAGYLSADFYVKGQHLVGLGLVSLAPGESLDSISFEVQGLYQGTVRVVTNCKSDSSFGALPDSFRYRNSERVKIFLPGVAESSCGVGFVISPEYPDEQKGPLRIYSFMGALYIRVLKPGDKWLGFTSKAASGNAPTSVIGIPVLGVSSVDVAFESDLCGVKFGPSPLPVVDGLVYVPLSVLMPSVKIKSCVLSGVVFAPSGPVRVSWFVNGYDTRFSPLPVPVVFVDDGKLTVSAGEEVSVVSLDDRWELDNEVVFKDFDANEPHVLRLITVKGRLLVGEYDPKKGWSWIF